jgi:glycosyltransferase involved in cell wall biosynthesis
MKLLFLTIGKKTTPSTRFRVKQYISRLDDDGISCDVKNIPHAFYKRLSLLKDLSGYDAVIIQKKLFSALELYLLTKTNPNIIYDFDDLVTAEHPMHKHTAKVVRKMRKNKKRFENTLRSARGIIAGNNFLKEKALNLNKNIAVIPTPVETIGLPVKEASSKKELIIGWIGTRSNLFYLDRLKRVWRELSDKFPGVSLKIVCNAPYESNEINVINKKWKAEDEAGDLLGFDIGIMPLTDDDWSKGKCGFKLLQYMAAGLPAVASAVGANTEIIEHGKNGFLASNEDEWIKCLSLLLTDIGLRKRMGGEARNLVEEKYSVSALKDRLVESIKRFILV